MRTGSLHYANSFYEDYFRVEIMVRIVWLTFEG